MREGLNGMQPGIDLEMMEEAQVVYMNCHRVFFLTSKGSYATSNVGSNVAAALDF